MPTARLPYMASPGLIPKVLLKIQEARKPERFTQDFLETKLGFSGGSARAVIPLLKRLNFIASDGTPNRLYDQFRNPDTQGLAMSEGIRNAFAELYERNEYVHALTKDKLTGLVTEVTGASRDDRTTVYTVSTFIALKDFADFDAVHQIGGQEASPRQVSTETSSHPQPTAPQTDDVSLAISYTINLNLPETTNPEVFNAIFKSLKEHLLARR